MSNCDLCAWVRKRFFPKQEAACEALWSASSDWEYYETGYFDMIEEECEANRAMLDEARELRPKDPGGARAIYLGLAQSGSPTAMFHTGWCLETGTGVERDSELAIDWYGQGLDAGSWTSALAYARLLDQSGDRKNCDKLLESGVDADIASAAYRLAKCRYDRSPRRRTAQEIRPLLDRAIARGHPGAKFLLSQLMSKGKFGFGNVFAGIRLGVSCMNGFEAKEDAEADARSAQVQL